MNPRAGALNRQITIQKQVTRQEQQFGTDVVDWESITLNERIWAEVQDVLPSRSETVRQGLAVARNQTRVRIRYRTDVDSTMRVIIHGPKDRTCQIVGGPAEIAGRQAMLEMVVEESTTDA